MEGVDRCENLVSDYRISVHGKKWLWSIFTIYLDISLVNAWKISRLSTIRNKKSILEISQEVALFLFCTPGENRELAKHRSANEIPIEFSISKSLGRFGVHFIIKTKDN
ncbi:DDE_Tnp_1_7 domain-containing protein [Nephila pilipes]|uniref:DDE_Tnp_1_7 domain-containing protein n=1 Tax=Nephila pilipes TaxID=299642 RepID=A0A8X6J333_NEPPI|nr:DDE_Tnp_1_7 domain-containing protein [Nephila pilipes]